MPSSSTHRWEPPVAEETPEARAYRRGFRQKDKRDDYALDLFHEARTKLGTDARRVAEILRELARLYNPLLDGPLVDPPTSARIMALVEGGHTREAAAVLDARYRLYAPLDDAERHEPGGSPA